MNLTMVLYIPGGCLGFLNHQQCESVPSEHKEAVEKRTLEDRRQCMKKLFWYQKQQIKLPEKGFGKSDDVRTAPTSPGYILYVSNRI